MLRDAYREAKQNPADEITFKWLRCNMWVSSTVAWIPGLTAFKLGFDSIEDICNIKEKNGSIDSVL